QHPVGPYILDFYCPSARLAIEVDGFAHDTVAEAHRDAHRQEWLAQRGVGVLRLRASDVLKGQNLEGALLGIKKMAIIAPSRSLRSPPPPLRGGGAQFVPRRGKDMTPRRGLLGQPHGGLAGIALTRSAL